MAIITVKNTANGGSGSLRDAIARAKAGDTIKFASTLANKTITLTSGGINITKNLIIDGLGANGLKISGNNSSRIFFVSQPNLNVTVKNLSFINGKASGSGSVGEGGAIKVYDYSTLNVQNSKFVNNSASRGGAIRVGYGGSLVVRNSTFNGNDGTLANDGFSAGAIATYGAGGPSGKGKLVIEGSTFVNNKGVVGGAVYNLLGPVTIKNSTFKNNVSTRQGGAIFTDGASGSEKDSLGGKIIIQGSRFEGNQAKAGGGALYLWTYKFDEVLIQDSTIIGNSVSKGGTYNVGRGGGLEFAGSNLKIVRSTIANNTAPVQGGGLWVNNNASSVNIVNSTISGNQALEDAGGGMFLVTPDGRPVIITNSSIVNNFAGRDAGGIWTNAKNSNDVKLTNTIFAGNTATVTKQGHTNFTLAEGGGNIIQTIPGGLGPVVTKNSRYVPDLNLGALQLLGNDYVHPLLSGSPAINGGTTLNAAQKDQRGILRDAKPDAGSFEFTSTITSQSSGSSSNLSSRSSDITTIESGLANDRFGTAPSINFRSGKSGVSRRGTSGSNTLRGTAHRDILRGQGGGDRLYGKNSHDQLIGGSGNDTLVGGNGQDLLVGQAGNDRIFGGGGNDLVKGGNGRDTLSGGMGRDGFVFDRIAGGVDTITDFSHTADTLDLRAIFAKPEFAGSTPGDRFEQFVRLKQVGANVAVQIDQDGRGAGTAFTTLASLTNVSATSLSPSNFVII